MKILICALVFFSSFTAHAESPVYGTGTAYGMCSGNDYAFCMPRIKEDAEYRAVRDMAFVCSGRQGGHLSGRPSCRTFCTPTWMQPTDPMQMVSCRADCDGYCTN